MVNFHGYLHHMVSREVLSNLFFVNRVKLFFLHIGIKRLIPWVKNGSLIASFISLELLKSFIFFLTFWKKPYSQFLLKVLDIHWGLRHSNGQDVLRVTLEAQSNCQLVPFLNKVLEERDVDSLASRSISITKFFSSFLILTELERW